MKEGLARAWTLLSSPQAPPPPLPQGYLPPPSDPVPSPIPGGVEPSREELRCWRNEVESFACSLPPDDATLFRAGHRLSRSSFDAMVAALPNGVAAERGLRIAGPPASGPVAPSLAALLVLMDSWHFLDPLLLEVCCDMRLHGMSLAFAGPTTPTAPPKVQPPNMFKPGSGAEAIAKALVDADIKAGNATGFFDALPRGVPVAIPMGLVPKGSVPDPSYSDPAAWRLIHNWSHVGLTPNGSISNLTESVVSSMQPLSLVLEDFALACGPRGNPGACAVKADWKAAYTLNGIAESDLWQMWSCFESGCYRRDVGAFGHKTVGFRHELRAKQTASLLALHQARQSYAGTDPLLVPSLRSYDPGPGPPPAGGFGSLRAATIFSPLGKTRLANLSSPASASAGPPGPRLDFKRWVDDWVRFYCTGLEAQRADACLALLHRRYGIPLSPKKHFVSSATDFGGVLFDCLSAIVSVPPEKCLRYAALVAALLRSAPPSLALWRQFLGSAVWACAVFPLGASFLTASFRAFHATARAGRPLPVPPAAVRELRFWAAVLKSVPASRVVFSTKRASDPSAADVIVMVDWSPNEGKQRIGIAVLSHGLFASLPIPSWFLRKFPVSSTSNCPSSPAYEAFAVVAYLHSFPHVASNGVSFVFSDNQSFLARTSELSSKGSPALDAALQLLALASLRTNAHLAYGFVESADNFSDPLSRDDIQAFHSRVLSAGISKQFLQHSPPSLQPPDWWRSLPASSPPPSLLRPSTRISQASARTVRFATPVVLGPTTSFPPTPASSSPSLRSSSSKGKRQGRQARP